MGEPDLEGFLESLDPTWSGLSLTMPLKKTIQPYGTPCNTWAKELMVANTAVFDWTKTCVNGNSNIPFIRLYNTDVRRLELAFEHSYQTRAITPKTDRSGTAVIIGNGNTATSALAACVEMSAIGHVIVVARHPEKNADLKPSLPNGICHRNSRSALSAWTHAIEALRQADVAINTIPGLAPDGIAESLRMPGVRMHGTLLDVVYDPRPTKLMQAWRQQGGIAIGGEEMLLYQAMVQVWLMTGIWDDDPPSGMVDQDCTARLEQAMRIALEEAL